MPHRVPHPIPHPCPIHAPLSRREKKGKKGNSPPASGLTLADYLSQYPAEDQETLRQAAQAIASTRKSGTVAESVLNVMAKKLARYPAAAVLAGCRIYLDRDYASEGKAEAYLLGIVRGEAKRMNGDGRSDAPRPTPPSGTAKTPGQLAIERALAAQQAETEARP